MGEKTAEALPRRALFGGNGTAGVMPWTDPQRIFERCTGCGACTRACPEGIVTSGRGGHPYIEFTSACTFCGACAEACPEDVFDTARTPPMAAVARIGESCFEPLGISCRACEDACPEMALRTRPQLGGTARVEVSDAACTGCGACVSVCPVNAVEIVPNA
ncbi:ferredoxin-type protein NapF [Psychromarinibacter sp. C21-152]|uniref:Ferredoxin-type protein NapF n=1 Tax=Psychromarinibacter sediminicola TaxID=3033385 RepID=A0AAE3TAX2_9RHOB|nr:ferredoxin-type protein NapF [Psychromarinibacter sediminicola]MDF0602439.1 ferredoxin-type protein NapF [Psychromarinibacter sediminicola]